MKNNSKFNLEWLQEVISDICKHNECEFDPIWFNKELTKEDLLLYDEILDKVKEGYLYSLERHKIKGRRMVIRTGSGGIRNAINLYKENGIDPNQVYEAIYVYGDKKTYLLKDVIWKEITKKKKK